MTTFKNYIDVDTLAWLKDNNIIYKLPDIQLDKGTLNILYNDKFCLKIYDQLGHGFGVTINMVDNYDESIFQNDNFSLHWAFEYFKIEQTASFDKRTENQYLENLPNLIIDLKNIIIKLNQITSLEWNNMKEWISREVKKQFS